MQYDLWWWTDILLCKYLFVIVCGETIIKNWILNPYMETCNLQKKNKLFLTFYNAMF